MRMRFVFLLFVFTTLCLQTTHAWVAAQEEDTAEQNVQAVNFPQGKTFVYSYTVVNRDDNSVMESQEIRVIIRNTSKRYKGYLIEIIPMSYHSNCELQNVSMFNISENIMVWTHRALLGKSFLFHSDGEGAKWVFVNEKQVKESMLDKVWNSYHEILESWAPMFELSIDELHSTVNDNCEEFFNESVPLLFASISRHRFDDFESEQADLIDTDSRRYNFTPETCDGESHLEEVRRTVSWFSNGMLKEYKVKYVEHDVVTHIVTLKQFNMARPAKP